MNILLNRYVDVMMQLSNTQEAWKEVKLIMKKSWEQNLAWRRFQGPLPWFFELKISINSSAGYHNIIDEEDTHSTTRRPQGADHEIISNTAAVQSIFQELRDKKLLLTLVYRVENQKWCSEFQIVFIGQFIIFKSQMLHFETT